MTPAQEQELVDNLSDLLIEGAKFAPDGKATQIIEKVQAKVAQADFTGKPQALKILHSAIKIGKSLSETTPSKADDKFFGKADQFATAFEENDGNVIGALIKSLFSKVDKKEKTEGSAE